jgi:very-short-patch-repair endonuclease
VLLRLVLKNDNSQGINMLNNYKKALRKSQTDAESIIWYHLRNRHFRNYKFRRQHVLHNYIVDFICMSKKIIIEIDGSQHLDQVEYDLIRAKKLENDGYKIFRFWNSEVLENLEEVLEVIYEALGGKHPSPVGASHRRPLPQGER